MAQHLVHALRERGVSVARAAVSPFHERMSEGTVSGREPLLVFTFAVMNEDRTISATESPYSCAARCSVRPRRCLDWENFSEKIDASIKFSFALLFS